MLRCGYSKQAISRSNMVAQTVEQFDAATRKNHGPVPAAIRLVDSCLQRGDDRRPGGGRGAGGRGGGRGDDRRGNTRGGQWGSLTAENRRKARKEKKEMLAARRQGTQRVRCKLALHSSSKTASITFVTFFVYPSSELMLIVAIEMPRSCL